MGKRPSFVAVVTDRLGFLADDHGFAGPEIQHPEDTIPAIARVSYHRGDATVEIVHVVGFMGENYVQTRCRRKEGGSEGDWMTLGNNTTRTGYQLRRAIEIHAQAIRSHLELT